MGRHLIIIIIISLLARPGCGQSFTDSYRSYCIHKINSSIYQRIILSSDAHHKSDEITSRWQTQLDERLNDQIKELSTIFKKTYRSTGLDFNKADSLTIIYETNSTSVLANFMIIAGKDTLTSTERLALRREINNGGGKLAPLNNDATVFKVYKTSNGNIPEPFLELAGKGDTAYAFEAAVYCPVDKGDNSIIITAKKNNSGYKIRDYYLHDFSFAAILARK